MWNIWSQWQFFCGVSAVLFLNDRWQCCSSKEKLTERFRYFLAIFLLSNCSIWATQNVLYKNISLYGNEGNIKVTTSYTFWKHVLSECRPSILETRTTTFWNGNDVTWCNDCHLTRNISHLSNIYHISNIYIWIPWIMAKKRFIQFNLGSKWIFDKFKEFSLNYSSYCVFFLFFGARMVVNRQADRFVGQADT